MSLITLFVNYLMSLIGKLGYLGLFIVIGLEYACFPIPSEIVLPFAGLSVTQTSLNFLPAFLVSIGAGLLGSWICYAIGYYGGEYVLNWLSRHSRQAKKSSDTFNLWFNKYGQWAVLLARIIPLTRTYISFFAGSSRMHFGEFMLYSSAGIALWNLVLMSLGFYIGDNFELINRILNSYSHIIIALVSISVLFILLKKLSAYKKRVY